MMSRLDDYLRAERPDTNEPASFYIPGADSWHGRIPGAGRLPSRGEDDEITDPMETIDAQEVTESAALQAAADLQSQEG
jgi:hypothetical protein